MIQPKHILYISRCLELAEKGLGNVAPNPMVGCVIVHNDKIIGEGYHVYYGGPHAEVNAIMSVKDKELLKHSTLYVNLEPCSHFGKTPPCTDLIIKMNIPQVVIASIDIYSEVSGKGIKKLRDAGVNVTLNVLSDKNLELNKRFYTFHQKKRPYVILKWAQTINAHIDIQRNGNTSPALKITNQYSDILNHKWRSEESAIMVGTNTAMYDNPRLNVRHLSGKNPIRIVIDRNLRLPDNLNLFDNSQKTIVFTEKDKTSVSENLTFKTINFNSNFCQNILTELFNLNIQSLIVEGGKTLLESFINSGLWDEARIFTSEKTFNYVQGVPAPKLSAPVVLSQHIHTDKLIILNNPEQSPKIP